MENTDTLFYHIGYSGCGENHAMFSHTLSPDVDVEMISINRLVDRKLISNNFYNRLIV